LSSGSSRVLEKLLKFTTPGVLEAGALVTLGLAVRVLGVFATSEGVNERCRAFKWT